MASSATLRSVAYPVTFTARIDAELRAAIADAAAREGSSASEWVRRSLAAIAAASSGRASSSGARPTSAHG